ncbi:MAG: Mini-ribonuclease 3 [Ruminococcaceae bacterium]|nr:Mini-ribonuclease 3 [Oscillospiraceae bacterium]
MFDFEMNAPLESISPLVFAYVGDAVHELYIRTMLSKDKNIPVNKLHKSATGYVSAKAQSATIKALEDTLSEEEVKIFKRGRNAKSPTAAKNADIIDYRHATGFETLLGYLYFKKDFKRLEEILKLSYEIHNQL